MLMAPFPIIMAMFTERKILFLVPVNILLVIIYTTDLEELGVQVLMVLIQMPLVLVGIGMAMILTLYLVLLMVPLPETGMQMLL